MASTGTGTWKLCEPKPVETVYQAGTNPCLVVIYRVTNDGPAAVMVSGKCFLDPGTSVDVSASGAGASINVALFGQPKCPPGSHVDDQMASGTYELLCCECCCPPQGATDTPPSAGAPPIISLQAAPGTLINAATGAVEKFITLSWTVTGGVGTVTVSIDLDPPFPHLHNPIWTQQARQGTCTFPNATTSAWAPQYLTGFPRDYTFTATVTDSSQPPLSSQTQVTMLI